MLIALALDGFLELEWSVQISGAWARAIGVLLDELSVKIAGVSSLVKVLVSIDILTPF